MPSYKLYTKIGKRSSEELKLLSELTKFSTNNPDITIKPAKDYAGLKKLYEKYCTHEVDFEEVNHTTNNDDPFNENSGKDDNISDEKDNISSLNDSDANDFQEEVIDPFNRSNPTIRDYVNEDKFSPNQSQDNISSNTSFSEPTNFKEAFELPNDGTADNKSDSTASSGKKSEKKSEPFNPEWEEMQKTQRSNTSKRFAKYIVETVCFLSEKGFVWYANKDINEAKLAEYELNNEMDLSILLTMPDGHKATVKEFFQLQCLQAEQLSKINDEEKQDLIKALAAVLLEKGIAPTPTQELMLISLKIFGGQAVALFAIKSQTNAVLDQLRTMKTPKTEQKAYEEKVKDYVDNNKPQEPTQEVPKRGRPKKVREPIAEIEGVFSNEETKE